MAYQVALGINDRMIGLDKKGFPHGKLKQTFGMGNSKEKSSCYMFHTNIGYDG